MVTGRATLHVFICLFYSRKLGNEGELEKILMSSIPMAGVKKETGGEEKEKLDGKEESWCEIKGYEQERKEANALCHLYV